MISKPYITGRENEFRTYWNEFKKSKKTTAFFNEWVEVYLKYETLSDLMIYPMCYARENMIKEDSFELPIEYYDKLEKYNLNDCSIISPRHADFLYDYCRWVLSNPRDSVTKANDYFHNQGIVSYDNHMTTNWGSIENKEPKLSFAKYISIKFDIKDKLLIRIQK